MESSKQPREESGETSTSKSGYGAGGYGNYGAYGSYGAYGASSGKTTQQTLQDYMLILRERIWYIVIAFTVVFAGAVIYTYMQTPLYQASATVEIFRRNPMVMQVQQVMESEVKSSEDLNTQVNILKSRAIVQRVANRLSPAEVNRLVAPYSRKLKPGANPPSPLGILENNRNIVPQRNSLILSIEYQHPDREMAAIVANLFADEYIAYSAHLRVDESMKAVDELEIRAKAQRDKVDDLARALQAYREKNNLVSLDQRKDIVTQKLKELSGYVTQSSATLQDAETRWKQVQAAQANGDNLLNLSFIATVPAVSQLQQQVASLKISLAQLGERYRPKHPKMIEARNSFEEAERQLQRAINTTTAQVESNYHTAQQNLAQARAALVAQENDSLTVDRFAVEYSNMERDYDINEKLLEHILVRMKETSMSSTVDNQNARLVDRAKTGGRPISPNYTLNIGLGIIGGLGVGLALAFFAAYADDRVKSAYDIESIVGLPLLAVVPKFKRPLAPGAKTALQEEPEIAEAFSTLYSSLRLKDEGRTAKCIVITSTLPGEGKSFIARNLALTFASHGERVLLIDCDLRRPTMHKLFEIGNLKGVIDVCTNGTSLESLVHKNVMPNLDVLPSGGRSKNPAQNLTSKNFEVMLVEARKRYDRVFIDTPPIAAVSDAIVILPLADGSIYSIFFNKVRRKAAQFCVERLLEVSVSHLGAVLNGLDQNIGGYYYHHYYYDKQYKDYYVTSEKDDDPNEPPRR